MKKLLSFILTLVLVTLFATGCNEASISYEQLSDNISNKLDKLSLSVTKLDTIDNQYIANPDIFPSTSQVAYIVPNPTITKQENAEPLSEQNIVKNIIASNTNENLQDALINKLINNLKCDNDGNCYICGNNYGNTDNNSCNSCNNSIICDSNGNCTYCNNCLTLDSFGNCTSCNKSCTSNSCDNLNNYQGFNQTTSNCANNYKNLLETNTTADNISLEINSDGILDNTTETEQENVIIDTNIDKDSLNSENAPKEYYY